jgi:hypothetical protein
MSCVVERGEGKMKGRVHGGIGFSPYVVFPSLTVPLLAGQPTFVFVTVYKSKRDFAAFVPF